MAGLGDTLGGIGGAVGGIVNLLGGFHGGQAEEQKAVDIMMKLQDPHFDPSQIPPADLKIFAQYFPEVYQAVIPDQVKLAVDSPEARAAQVRSLGTLESMRDQGMPLAERVAAQEAGNTLSGEIGRGQEYATRDLAQRGRAGGGEEWAARVGGGQAATEAAAAMSRGLVAQGAQNRLAGAQGAAQLGGQIRGADIGFSRNAADAINRFNEMRTGRRNEAAATAAAVRNVGALSRASETQRIGETNQNNIYNAAWQNRQRQDQNELAAKNFALTRAGAQADTLMAQAARKDARERARQAAIVAAGQGAGKGIGGIADVGLSL